jgi:hypothetical protein
MNLEETEARNDCAGEGQQQFNREVKDRSMKLVIRIELIISNLNNIIQNNRRNWIYYVLKELNLN